MYHNLLVQHSPKAQFGLNDLTHPTLNPQCQSRKKINIKLYLNYKFSFPSQESRIKKSWVLGSNSLRLMD